MDKSCVIVLPTHSNYLGVCKNFVELLKKNWMDCPYELWISYAGDRTNIEWAFNTIYNGKAASLTECLYNLAEKVNADYYISFLGDAFINSRIDSNFIIELLKDIENNNIEYCSLMYVKNYYREKSFNEQFRYIHTTDRYSHNFVSFIASDGFIKSTLHTCNTDLEFEKHYLEVKEKKYYNSHIAIKKNYLGLVPAITNGKWNRLAYNKLVRDNPDISFDEREVETLAESLYQVFHDEFIWVIPSGLRVRVKKIMRLLGGRFATDL